MPIDVQLNDLLKEAMRAKDSRTADCIRMIKTKHMERRTAAGFKGPLDDALWLDVIERAVTPGAGQVLFRSWG